jgi:hypothetical protein
VSILNRIVTVTEKALEYQADQRHAEIIVKDLELTSESKGVVTPGVNEREEGGEELGEFDASRYRAIAARANYLAQDRADVHLAAKEISRFTSNPEPEDWRMAKRLGRYLKENVRMVLEENEAQHLRRSDHDR